MSDAAVTGGCQCGAVRYRLKTPPHEVSVCFCRMCQKAAGSYFGAFASSRIGEVEWTRGQPAIFNSSEVAERGFCRDCGTPLFYDGRGAGHINVTLGSLDDPDDIRPIAQSGVESRVVFFQHLPKLPESESNEGEGGEERHVKIRASNRQHPDYDTDHWPPGDL